MTAYFAPQFSELRKRSCEGGEPAFVASLSRCRPWQAQGGKSRSYFAKTADDRFIVKQLSAPEKKSFLALGPSYFKYLFEGFRKKQPTCLAKIFGVYTVWPAPPRSSFFSLPISLEVFTLSERRGRSCAQRWWLRNCWQWDSFPGLSTCTRAIGLATRFLLFPLS